VARKAKADRLVTPQHHSQGALAKKGPLETTTSPITKQNKTTHTKHMSTKNHKSTNNTDKQPIRTSLTHQRARCGKVARLPKEIRDQLNRMLLDGVPYTQIIQKLRENFGTPPSADSNIVPITPGDTTSNPGTPTSPPSDSVDHATRNTEHASSIEHLESLQSLTPLNITNWKKFGGYRDWLRDQQRVEECKIRHELTLDLARSAEGLASYQAAPKVAVAQICQTIIDLGPEGIKDAMKDSPLNCFRLLNALARLVNSGLKCEQVVAKQRPVPEKCAGFTPPVIEKMENALNLM
jgi:hypothetical protein